MDGWMGGWMGGWYGVLIFGNRVRLGQSRYMGGLALDLYLSTSTFLMKMA
jgi:hypothetical protein